MATKNSRGEAVSAYIPPFFFGAKIFGKNMKAAFLSGTLVSGGVVTAVAHGLSAQPVFITVGALPTRAQAISGTGTDVFLAQAASATTTTNFYIVGSQKANVAEKWNAWVIIN